ncbi:MAG TPA: cytochrome c oxidase subunit II [Candidatus Binatia bacterium]|nr:cytochrome c oxidase subunit II [Candidatus Binatia bacterium]
MFSPVSAPAESIRELSWLVFGISAGILIVVVGVLAYCVIRFRERPGDDREPPQIYGSNQIELAWTLVPALIVVVLFLATARTINELELRQPPPGALKTTIVGHQWWWEIRYPDLGIVTANELHLPVAGEGKDRVAYLTLESADVIHSFWVPQLAGKTDVVPNRVNGMWVAPREAGTYLGQCAEYCGTQHAHMLLRVIVHPQADFDAWVAAQKRPEVVDAAVADGRAVFQATACVNCHTLGGTGARGTFGPDLTHLMSRETIGAGAAENTPENLRAWIVDPDHLKPGVLMPAMKLDRADIDKLTAYLLTLQ